MFKKTASFLLIGLLAMPVQAALLGNETSQIIVTGQGTVKAQADTAQVLIGVEKLEMTAAAAQQTASQKINNILSALEKMGIPKNKLETTQINLYPQYNYDKGKRTLIGYNANNQLKASIDNLPDLGKVIDNAVAAGATNIDGITFALRDEAPLKQAALQQAFRDAENKAQGLAAAANLTIKKVKQIQEANAQVISPLNNLKAMALDSTGAGSETTVSPGKVVVKGEVSVLYECGPKK
jgi:uncharacterized protein